MPSDILLCGERGSPHAVTIATYQSWEKDQDRGWSKKPGFLQQRLFERYVEPVRALDLHSDTKERKNGFYIMAVSCLLIETLESFWQGWETTEPHKDVAGQNIRGKSKEAFRLFFARQHRFGVFAGTDFYKRVRCGILHQGETTDGWKILRSGPMFDGQKTLNAVRFHNHLRLAVFDYVQELQNARPGSSVRDNFDKKMQSVINNCL
jgi:hypothetical protein